MLNNVIEPYPLITFGSLTFRSHAACSSYQNMYQPTLASSDVSNEGVLGVATVARLVAETQLTYQTRNTYFLPFRSSTLL